MQTALLKSACHVASVQRDLVAKVEEFGLTQTPPRTQTLLGIFDGSLGTRFMSKAQKRKGGKGWLNLKGGAPRPVFRPSHDLLSLDYRRYSQKALEYEADNINWKSFELFVLVYKPSSVRIDPRKRLRETSLAAPATIFGLWRRDTFFHPWFSARFRREKKNGLKNCKKCQEKWHT